MSKSFIQGATMSSSDLQTIIEAKEQAVEKKQKKEKKESTKTEEKSK